MRKYWYYHIQKVMRNKNIINSDGVVSTERNYFPIKSVDKFYKTDKEIECIILKFAIEISEEDFNYLYAKMTKTLECAF